MPLISDPPPNIKKYGFTPHNQQKDKKNGIPLTQVDLNGTAISINKKNKCKVHKNPDSKYAHLCNYPIK